VRAYVRCVYVRITCTCSVWYVGSTGVRSGSSAGCYVLPFVSSLAYVLQFGVVLVRDCSYVTSRCYLPRFTFARRTEVTGRCRLLRFTATGTCGQGRAELGSATTYCTGSWRNGGAVYEGLRFSPTGSFRASLDSVKS